MSKLEVFLIVVALFNVGVVLELVRRRTLSEGYALLWLLVALAGVAYVGARSAVDEAAEAVGIASGLSLVLGAAVVFLLFVCMSLSLHVSRLEAKTEVLAEEVAMLHGVREPEPKAPEPKAKPAKRSARRQT
jgi:hypothetical protein